MKEAHYKHKIYVYKGRTFTEFHVGEHVFLNMRENKSSLKLGSCKKLEARYRGSFDIFTRKSQIAYELELPTNINTHDIFHVSLLKNYIHDSNNIIDWNVIQVELEGDFHVQQVCIFDRKVIMLRNYAIW